MELPYLTRIPGKLLCTDLAKLTGKSRDRCRPANQTQQISIEKKLSSFIRSCIGDVIYDRYEKAKIKLWDSIAFLLGALIYFVASRYR
jgi:hypothetical protein